MADEILKIDNAAEAFYRAMPEANYPTALIDGYPRIAMKIHSLRGNKIALAEYFDSLLNDERGSRQGFPFRVIVNIQGLYEVMIGIPDGFFRTGRHARSTSRR
jgi:hypothetical protein